MSFFTGFGVSALIYWLLNVVFPASGAHKEFLEIDLSTTSLDDDRSESGSDREAAHSGDDIKKSDYEVETKAV